MSEQNIQTEIQRLQCLQALGITVYHPRYRLPGARPSTQGVWPELEPEAQAETASPQQRVASAPREERADAAPRAEAARVAATANPAVTARPADTGRPAAERPRLSLTETPATSSPQAKSSTTPSAPAADIVPVQNFQLLFLQIDAELALINQIPALARPQLQDKQMALLTNLLRWLGKPVPAQAPRMFRWPLPGLEHMATTMRADTSLLHFLEQANSERSFRYLLQLGPQAVAPKAHGWTAFSTHSLDEMLALPALKREAWQSLLPLHALLHSAP